MSLFELHQSVRTGCRPSDPQKLIRELRLAHYMDAGVFAEFIPPVFHLQQDVPQFMDLNDQLGCCVVSEMAKQVRLWTQNATGVAATVTDQDVLTVYENGAGYNPADPNTDQGWTLLDQLAYWVKTGIAGHKIGAYVSVNPKHHFMMRAACYLFEGLDIALSLPLSAQGQAIWDVDTTANGAPGSWGGHCVLIAGIDDNDYPLIETWGYEQQCTWAFLDKYCTEAHAIISSDALNGTTEPLTGLDMPALLADLNLVK